jgi:hypothetical protein
MTLFTGHDREALRATWREAWRRYRDGLPLAPLQVQLADIVAMHPEYQAILEDEAAPGGRDRGPGQGEGHPFLHMGLHAAVREAVATDRPPGIRPAFEALLQRAVTPHDAEHVLAECLGETLWEAQRAAQPPDAEAWLERVRRRSTAR